MVPPGLSFTAISDKALAAARAGGSRRSYWDWEPLVTSNKTGFFPYTPAVNLLFALNEALDMLAEEGLPTVFARHSRYAEATRRAAAAWGLELQCLDPRAYAPGVTAIRTPGGPQRRPPAHRHPRAIQHEPRQRARPYRGPRVPHRPHGRPGRAVAHRHADGRGDGPARRRHPAPGRRRPGGDELPGIVQHLTAGGAPGCRRPPPRDARDTGGNLPGVPPAGLHQLRRPGRPSGLLSRRTRHQAPLADRGNFRRSRRPLPVHARPRLLPDRHGDRPAPGRPAWDVRCLAGLHPALGTGDDAVRLRRRRAR